MAYVQEIVPLARCGRMLIGLIGFATTNIIVYSEISKRQLPTTKFSSKYLCFTSAVCIWCGPISSLLLILSVVPGFCMMRLIGSAMVLSTQFQFMSFYQLSRLHYCFSNQQLRANKGYPLWIFVVMIIIGIILWICILIQRVAVDTLPAKCGYTNKVEYQST